jgi:hypothetical protein
VSVGKHRRVPLTTSSILGFQSSVFVDLLASSSKVFAVLLRIRGLQWPSSVESVKRTSTLCSIATGFVPSGFDMVLPYFFFGPGLRVPFSSRAFSIRARFQSLTALPFTSLTRGALIFPVPIQYCKVARGIFVIFATCTVV